MAKLNSKYKLYGIGYRNYRKSKNYSRKKYNKSNNFSYSDIKEDLKNLYNDFRKGFKNKKVVIPPAKSREGELIKKALVGLLVFIILSCIVSFPISLLICLILAALYFYR
ncbi:hypothetical protein [Clostridium mediterraneense]|uniref:hypothetical protein n=1 Tax=Clostridium mediterraneense TaxID=1805472 RepID=UPI0008355B17|nr:hypothetical protein [Clostridium mediterraneense]